MNITKSQDSVDMDASNPKNIVILGEIVSVFGVKGFCKINSFTDPKSNIVKYYKSGINFLWRSKKAIELFELSKAWTNMPIEEIKSHTESKVVVKIKGCDDRDLADKLRGVEIAIIREDLSKYSKKNEHFWHDLIGLEVYNTEDIKLGVVSHLIATGANDVLVVKKDLKEHLVPFVIDQYIIKVDYEMGKIIVDWDIDF